MTSQGFKIYVVAVYYRDSNTVLRHYTTWRGEAEGEADAKYQAILSVLADARAIPLSKSWKAEIIPAT